jgi:hypothetical protein
MRGSLDIGLLNMGPPCCPEMSDSNHDIPNKTKCVHHTKVCKLAYFTLAFSVTAVLVVVVVVVVVVLVIVLLLLLLLVVVVVVAVVAVTVIVVPVVAVSGVKCESSPTSIASL